MYFEEILTAFTQTWNRLGRTCNQTLTHTNTNAARFSEVLSGASNTDKTTGCLSPTIRFVSVKDFLVALLFQRRSGMSV